MTTAASQLIAPSATAAGRGVFPRDARIAAAYEQCAAVARSRARNFYYGLRLTPEPRRSAIYSVYAWMRAADDQADQPGAAAEKRARLAGFRATTEQLLAGEPLGDAERNPVWIAFRATFQDYGLSPRDLLDVFEGLSHDISTEQMAEAPLNGSHRNGSARGLGGPGAGAVAPAYASREELLRYCYCVASTVGLICITIWGLREGVSRETARALAVRRGHAFQLTNILRDFTQDHTEGRVYLPAADFARAGLSPESLRAWSEPERCRAMIADLAAWARAEYRASAGLEELIDPSCVPTLWTMTEIYSGLLDIIERDPARIAGPRRIRLSSWRKGTLALRALMMARRESR